MFSPNRLLVVATLTAALAAQQPPFFGSLDRTSPELGLGRSAGDVLALTQANCNLDRVFAAQTLGVPQGGNVDAISNGFDVFAAKGPAEGPGGGRAVIGLFSVDRTSQGNGGAVRNEAQGNGASSDIFQVPLLPFAQPAQLRLDAGCLDGRRSNLDGLIGDVRFPLFFSVDAQTAPQMNVSPADILWVPAPGAQPTRFCPGGLLGLVAGDDIDALAVGPEGILFSLTRTSPTAQASPLMGGAGVFTMGGLYWATASQMGLLATDELDALMFDPTPRGFELLHTPLLPGHNSIFRIDGALPGESAFVFLSFRGLFPFCVQGLCLDILPEILLGVMPSANPLGSASFQLPIPPHTDGLDIATQAILPRGPLGAGWAVSNPVLAEVQFAWVTNSLVRNAGTNGYTITSRHGVDIINFVDVRDSSGAPLNGTFRVTITGTLNGQEHVWQPAGGVTFVNGNATWAPAGADDTIVVTGVRVYSE